MVLWFLKRRHFQNRKAPMRSVIQHYRCLLYTSVEANKCSLTLVLNYFNIFYFLEVYFIVIAFYFVHTVMKDLIGGHNQVAHRTLEVSQTIILQNRNKRAGKTEAYGKLILKHRNNLNLQITFISCCFF